jgi:RHS repeat-associated protein
VWYTLSCLATARTGYVHGDHLNSTTLTTDQSGNLVAETRYLPYGGLRWESGAAVTDFGFTGQRAEAFGLLDYNARYYSPALGRFISADSLVPNPGNAQNLNRYAYAGNNPVRYTDPTGHYLFEEGPDDPFIWRQDKPGDTNTLIRSAEPVVFWEETRDNTPPGTPTTAPSPDDLHERMGIERPSREPVIHFSLEGGITYKPISPEPLPNPHIVLRDDLAEINAGLMLGVDIVANLVSSIGTLFVIADTVAAPADPTGKAFGLWLAKIGTLTSIGPWFNTQATSGPLGEDALWNNVTFFVGISDPTTIFGTAAGLYQTYRDYQAAHARWPSDFP